MPKRRAGTTSARSPALKPSRAEINQAASIAPKIPRIYAPHTSHEVGFAFVMRKSALSGRLRSATSNTRVMAIKRPPINGAPIPKSALVVALIVWLQFVNIRARAATIIAPAPIDFVPRYVETFQPHGALFLGVS